MEDTVLGGGSLVGAGCRMGRVVMMVRDLSRTSGRVFHGVRYLDAPLLRGCNGLCRYMCSVLYMHT